MAPNYPIRANFQSGTVVSSLNSTATAISFAAAPAIPTLAADQYVPITLIDTAAMSNNEVMYLTAYTNGNTSGGVLRAQETGSGGGTSRTWSAASPWEVAPTVRDYAPQITLAGNTAGVMASMAPGLMTLAGGNNVTLSQGGNGVTISGGGVAAVGVSNTAGGTTAGTMSLVPGRAAFYAGSNINLSQSVDAGGQSASITISAAAGGGGMSGHMWPEQAKSNVFSNIVVAQTTGATATTMSATVFPLNIQNNLTINEVLLPVINSATVTVTNANASYTFWAQFGLHPLPAASNNVFPGAVLDVRNRQRISLASTNTSGSGSATFNMEYGRTAGGTTISLTTASATATAWWSQFTGSKLLPFLNAETTISAGQYIGIFQVSSSSAGSNIISFGISAAHDAIVTANTLQKLNLSTGSSSALYPPYMGIGTAIYGVGLEGPYMTASNVTSATNSATRVNRSLNFVLRRSVH